MYSAICLQNIFTKTLLLKLVLSCHVGHVGHKVHYEHLYRFAYEIVQEEEAAQDIVSDTFTVLLEKEHNHYFYT